MKVTRSKSGVPCLFEEGGSDGNQGRAIIIADSAGIAKRALYTIKGNANGQHAVIPVCAGDTMMVGTRDSDASIVRLYRIMSIGADDSITLKDLEQFTDTPNQLVGEWRSMLNACRDKLAYINCRSPLYALDSIGRSRV